MAYNGLAISTGGGSDIASTDALSEGSANLYYTDARVTANPTVAANTTNAATALTTANTANTAAGAANALAVTANAGVAANDSDITALQTGKADTSAIPTNYVRNDASDVMNGWSYTIEPPNGVARLWVKGTSAWVHLWDVDNADQDLARSALLTSSGVTRLRAQLADGTTRSELFVVNHSTQQANLYGDVIVGKTGSLLSKFGGSTQSDVKVSHTGSPFNERDFGLRTKDSVSGYYSYTDAGVATPLWRTRSGQGVSFGNPGSGIPTTRGHINAEEIFRDGVIAGLSLDTATPRVLSGGTATTNTPFNLTGVAVNAVGVVLRLNNTGTSTDRFSVVDTTEADFWTRPQLSAGEAQVVIVPKTKGNTTLLYRRYADTANSDLTIDILGFIG